MALMLSNDDAAKVLTMTDTIAALEALYMDLGNGSAIYRGRTDLFAPTTADIGLDVPAAHQFKTLDGSIPRLQAASVRVTSDVVAFPDVNGLRRRIKIPAATGKAYVGLVFLFSSSTGELISIMQDGMLQRFTVGAVNAIAAKYLSRSDSSTVGLIGAGGQAGPQLSALKEVRPIQRVRVYSQGAGEAAAFAETMSASLKLDITIAQTPEAAIRGADIAVTATNSRVPFFPAQWLDPGMHLSCMQRDEAQDDCFAQADVVVFHTREKEHEYVSTDFSAMEKQYGFVMRDHPPRDLDWNKFPDLGELVAGRINGREGAEQRTLFLNSTGVGAQFTALADLIYRGARESGLGHEMPAEWFVESIQP
jgi:ornithine cyclodeaminase/alanine dehydrogenase-like protein (mu-crystallin family)